MADRRQRQADGGFAARLQQIIAASGSASALAKAIDRSEGAVRKWLRGESEPNVTDLRALCEHTRTDIEWLVTGRGHREAEATVKLQEAPAPHYGNTGSQPLDHRLLEKVIEAIDAQLRADGVDLTSTKRSMLVVTLYDLCAGDGRMDPEAVERLVRLAR